MYFLKKNELVLGIAVIVTNKACVQLFLRCSPFDECERVN